MTTNTNHDLATFTKIEDLEHRTQEYDLLLQLVASGIAQDVFTGDHWDARLTALGRIIGKI